MSFYKNKKIVATAIAVISLVGITWFAAAHWPVAANVDVHWPTKSQTHTLLLQPAASNESTRIVDFAPDQKTILGMRIEYRDGRTALVTYQNGKPTTVSRYFAVPVDANAKAATPQALVSLKTLSDGLASRAVETKIEFKADGKTVKALTTFRADGNFASVGVRDAANDFVVTYYGTGTDSGAGAGLTAIAVYSGTDGSLKSEQDFSDDGSGAVVSSFTSTEAGSAQGKQTFFDASGAKTREVLYGYSDVTINQFASDGKTMTSKTTFNYSGVTVAILDSTGKTVIERNYSDDSHVNIIYYDKNGNQTMKQEWVKLDPATMPADRVGVVVDGFVLSEVYEYHSDGNSIKSDMTFYPGGKIVKEYESRPTTDYRPKTDQHFRQDGSLDYTDFCPPSSVSWTCNTTKEADGPNKVRVPVPASYYKVEPFLPAPSTQKPALPSMKLTVDLR